MIWTRWFRFPFVFLLILILSDFVHGYELRVAERSVSDAKRPEYVMDEVLVAFRPGTSDRVIYEIHERCGASAAYPGFSGRFERVKFAGGKSVKEMIAAYECEPDVCYAEPNYIAYALSVPNDPLYSYQWHLHSPASVPGGADVERAWDISTGENVVVAVVDTGVAYEDYGRFRQAPDLAGVHFVQGYDFVDYDSHPNDENGHGTHVTGVIAQRTNNGYGVAGAAFDCCIMPIRVLDEEAYGTYYSIAEAVYFAVENGARVINLSLGGGQLSTSLRMSLAFAHDKGVTLVAAGGNEYTIGSPPSYPAAYDAFCISVGAVRYDGKRAWYSTRADYIDISAPGGDTSMDQNNDGFADGILQQSFMEDPREFAYIFYEGTSFAAPHVSAAAAMLISCGLTDPDEIAKVLMLSARDMGKPEWDSEYGWGILDIYEALKYASKVSGQHTLCNENGRIHIKATNQDDQCEKGISYSGYGNEGSPMEGVQQITASSCDLALRSDSHDPNSTYLYQNYPNPFNPETWMPYQLGREAKVVIRIYDPTGRMIRLLNLGYKSSGFYLGKDKAAYWNGENDWGEKVSSGIYFYSLVAGDFTATRKLTVLE